MKIAKKMMLVPLIGRMYPQIDKMHELDKKMFAILNNNKLTTKEKLQMYSQVLLQNLAIESNSALQAEFDSIKHQSNTNSLPMPVPPPSTPTSQAMTPAIGVPQVSQIIKEDSDLVHVKNDVIDNDVEYDNSMNIDKDVNNVSTKEKLAKLFELHEKDKSKAKTSSAKQTTPVKWETYPSPKKLRNLEKVNYNEKRGYKKTNQK